MHVCVCVTASLLHSAALSAYEPTLIPSLACSSTLPSYVFSSYTALNAGLVGLGLTYAISLSSIFQYCIRLSAEVENVVSSVHIARMHKSLTLHTVLIRSFACVHGQMKGTTCAHIGTVNSSIST